MFLNRVIVLTVRQAGVYVCVRVFAWALLLQGADNREVCLNREGAQRPCSSCRLWKWMIGPPYSLHPQSVPLSVCLLWQIFTHYIFCSTLHLCFLSSCVCARVCVMTAPGNPHWATVFLLSNLHWKWLMSMHVTLPANYLCRQTRMNFCTWRQPPTSSTPSRVRFTYPPGAHMLTLSHPLSVYMFLFLMLSFPHRCTFTCVPPLSAVQLRKEFLTFLSRSYSDFMNTNIL